MNPVVEKGIVETIIIYMIFTDATNYQLITRQASLRALEQ